MALLLSVNSINLVNADLLRYVFPILFFYKLAKNHDQAIL